VGGIVLGAIVCIFIARRKKADPAVTADEGQAGAPLPTSVAGAAEATKSEQTPAPAAEEAMDFEQLLQHLTRKVAEKVGPKLAKGEAARNILEDRATGIKAKAKAFLLNELNSTARDILKAVEAEEAALMLDWNNAISTNFPPASVLLAGVLSPAIISTRQVAHLAQLTLGLVPILALCAWATIHDYKTVCAIPTIYAWSYVQGGLALILTIGNMLLYLRIVRGKQTLTTMTEAMNARLKATRTGSGEEMGFSELRETLVCSSVLLQQALLVEDSVRNTFWHTVVGAGSILWLLTVIWNFVIVMGWTFMPGTIAFHPKAYSVAPDEFCGALVTVFAARLTCILHLLFLLMTFIVMAGWICDVMTRSESFGKGVLKQAEKIDQGILGVPVVQLLVKAFVLRGGMDTTSARLSVTTFERVQLQRNLAQAQQRLTEIDNELAAHQASEEALKAAAGSDETEDLQASITRLEMFGSIDVNALKAKGSALAAELQAQAGGYERTTTTDLEAMIKKISDVADAIQQTEAFQSAMSQAQEAADVASRKAAEVTDQLNAESLQSAMTQAQQAAQQVVGQVQGSDAVRAAQQSGRLGRLLTGPWSGARGPEGVASSLS